MVAHSGLGITMFAIAGLTAWEVEDIRVTKLNEAFSVGGYELTLTEVRDVKGPNYISTMGTVEITRNGRPVTELFPEKRDYPVARMPTTEAAIDYRFLRDLYVVIGDKQADGGWTIRTYIKPFANWIWGGCILMALGGFLSLSDRRFRVAAGARKAPAGGVPAE
jgi:cytochrome c-type biogenesis protein CcmF